MINRLHPIDENETKKSTGKRTAVVALVAGAALATAGCESDTPKAPETLSPNETAARVEAHSVFDNLKASDIVKCQVARISEGPVANYQGEKRPSLKVSMSIEPGDRYDDRWLVDGGSRVGNYSAEIMWMNPGIQVSHDLLDQEDSDYAGAAVPKSDFDPNSEIYPHSQDAPFFEHQVDNSSEQLVTYVIPINDGESFRGKREMNIGATVGFVQLRESDPVGTSTVEKRLSETCATVDIDVSEGNVSVLSAHGSNGQSIN